MAYFGHHSDKNMYNKGQGWEGISKSKFKHYEAYLELDP